MYERKWTAGETKAEQLLRHAATTSEWDVLGREQADAQLDGEKFAGENVENL